MGKKCFQKPKEESFDSVAHIVEGLPPNVPDQNSSTNKTIGMYLKNFFLKLQKKSQKQQLNQMMG